MESMHKIVEFERIDIPTFQTIEVDAKFIQRFAQFTIMCDRRPFSNSTLDPSGDFLHVSVRVTTTCFSRGGSYSHRPPSAASRG